MAESDSQSNRNDFDLSKYYVGDAVKNLTEVTPKDLLGFAKSILLFLFILVIFVFTASYVLAKISVESSPVIPIINSILDISKTAIPSIVTLVLGFYFGKKEPSSN